MSTPAKHTPTAIDALKAVVAALKALTTEETSDRTEYLINEREGGDCTIIEAMEIAFEVAGVDAALALATPVLEREG